MESAYNRETMLIQNPPCVPKDSILGLLQTLKEDSRKDKVDLLAGVLKAQQRFTLFKSVEQAQFAFLKEQDHKNYLPISGDKQAINAMISLIWQDPSSISVRIQTLGATGALFLIAHLAQVMGYKKLILSKPSWPNHERIFKQAGLSLVTYNHLEEDALVALKELIKNTDIPTLILLQPLCHNPTGRDFTFDQLGELFSLIRSSSHLLIFDVPYMGFKWGIDEEARYIERLTQSCSNWLMSYSCSKNMTLYGERLGMLFGSFSVPVDESRIQNYLEHLVRASYSNPPLHGSGIAKTLLLSNDLKSLWKQDVDDARANLNGQRELLATSFEMAGFKKWALEIRAQSGLFGYFPLSTHQTVELREKNAIYLPLEGRVNLSSLNPLNCKHLVEGLLEIGVGV